MKTAWDEKLQTILHGMSETIGLLQQRMEDLGADKQYSDDLDRAMTEKEELPAESMYFLTQNFLANQKKGGLSPHIRHRNATI